MKADDYVKRMNRDGQSIPPMTKEDTNAVTELRELVTKIISEWDNNHRGFTYESLAEDILAIVYADPRIAAALKLLDEQERLKLGPSVRTRITSSTAILGKNDGYAR